MGGGVAAARRAGRPLGAAPQPAGARPWRGAGCVVNVIMRPARARRRAPAARQVAWEAHIAGYAAGLLLIGPSLALAGAS